MSDPTNVAGIYVGFYKDFDFFEFDCPHCGKTHTISVHEEVDEEFVMKVPCSSERLRMTGCIPIITLKDPA